MPHPFPHLLLSELLKLVGFYTAFLDNGVHPLRVLSEVRGCYVKMSCISSL